MKAAIGIDIGGTNVQVAMVSRKGEILRKDHFPVASMTTDKAFFNVLNFSITNVKNQFGEQELEGIGIGTPGANIAQGTIEKASNLPWNKLPIVDYLTKQFLLPVCMTNDANLFAIGEKVFGKATDLKDFVVLTLGTGVGAGIYSGNELLLGRDGLAGELGHVVVEKGGRECQCGRKGCLERYVSASGVVLTARELLKNTDVVSTLRQLPENELTSISVAEAARSEDPIGVQVFRLTGITLGEALANVEASFNPAAIFLAGGLTKAGSLLFGPTIESFKLNRLGIYPGEISILPSSIPDNEAGVMGAAALVWDSIEQNNRIEKLSVI